MPTNTLIADAGTVLVDTASQGGATGQHSAALSDGRIVVTWQETTGLNGDGSGSAIKAKVLNADGSTAIDEFLVNSTVQGDQTLPAVAALQNGRFVVTWNDASNGVTKLGGVDIRAQVFAADGFRQGSEILANAATAGRLTGSQVAGLSNGNFVVAWTSTQAQAGNFTVIDANGALVIAKTTLPAVLPNTNKLIDLAADPNGGFHILVPLETPMSMNSPYSSLKFSEQGVIIESNLFFYSKTSLSKNADYVLSASIPDFIVGETGVPIISFLEKPYDSLLFAAPRIANFINNSNIPVDIFINGDERVSVISIESLQFNDFILAYVKNNILHVGSVISSVYSEAGYVSSDLPPSATELDISVTTGGRVFVSWTNAAGAIEGKFFNYDGTLAAKQDGTAGDDVLVGTPGMDLLRGLQGNDLVLGREGDDYLLGGDGNDILDGGPGADTMEGGAGDDQYLVDNAGDVVTEAAIPSYDTVWVGANGWTVAANTEVTRLYGVGTQVSGSTGNDVVVANGGAASSIAAGEGNDEIWGGGPFAHTLNGGAGDDVIRGQDSPAVMIGGTGNDQFVVGNVGATIVENVGEGIDTAWVGVDGWTNAANVEIARLAAPGAVTLLGNEGNEDLVANQAAASRIDGNGGSDTLWGSPFADTLSGGAGDDIMRGQGGADVMSGGVGNDQYVVFDRNATVIESQTEGYDIVYFAGTGSFFIGNNVEEARLVASGTGLVGNGLDNLMAGNSSGLASTLDGGAGNDIMFGTAAADRFIGGAGNDTMYSQGGADVFAYRAAGWGFDKIAGWTAGACKLQFEAASGVTNFSQLTLSSGGGNTQVEYAGSTIVVFGVLLSQTDFLFV
jgi:Ca2+-binding RTX toxin-like protein